MGIGPIMVEPGRVNRRFYLTPKFLSRRRVINGTKWNDKRMDNHPVRSACKGIQSLLTSAGRLGE